MAIANQDLVKGTTTTSGTGPFVVSAVAGARSFSTVANGIQVTITRWDAAGNYESGVVSVSTISGVTTLTWAGPARQETSNGGSAVTWAAGGTQNVNLGSIAKQTACVSNNLAEYSAAGDASCASLGAATDGVRGLSGGSDGRVVRYISSNTVTNAQNTDTNDQLGVLLYRSGGKYYRPGELVPGTSLTAGQSLWLGDNSTPFLTSAPTPSSSVRLVYLGKAMSTTTWHFRPGQPVGG